MRCPLMMRPRESLRLVIVTCALALVSAQNSNLPRCGSILRGIHPELFTHCVCTWSEWTQWRPWRPVSNDIVAVDLVDPSICSSGEAFREIRFRSGLEVGCNLQSETRTICCIYGNWSNWIPVPNTEISASNCSSGKAYTETRTRSSTNSGCDEQTETRQSCQCVYGEWSDWEMVENSVIYNVSLSQCPSGAAFEEIHFRTAPGCEPQNETRMMCTPDREDQLIMILNLGSPAPTPPPTNSTPTPVTVMAGKRQATLQTPQCPVLDPADDGFICHDLFNGKRSVAEDEELTPDHRQTRVTPVTMEENPLPFEWRRHHSRFRRQTQQCGPQSSEDQYILFLLDTSGSIGSAQFSQMTAAVGKLTGFFCKRPKVAVMTFGSDIRLEFCFNCFGSDSDGRNMTRDAIRAIQYRGGATYTGEAARCACEEILNPFGSCGFPLGANCLDVIFITDGRSNGQLPVCDEVQCIHGLNTPGSNEVNTYALGIGNAREEEIECITDSRNNLQSVFRYDDFDDFEASINAIENRIESQQQYECANVDESLGPNPGMETCEFGEWSDWRPRSSSDQCDDQNPVPYEEVRTRSVVVGGCRVQLESREVCCPFEPWSAWSVVPGSEMPNGGCTSRTERRTRSPTMGGCEMECEERDVIMCPFLPDPIILASRVCV